MTRGYVRSNVPGMASNGTVKLVADISPQLKAALDRKARAERITKRAAIEQAITDYVQGGKTK